MILIPIELLSFLRIFSVNKSIAAVSVTAVIR